MSLKSYIAAIPATWKLPLTAGLVLVLALGTWLYGTRITNAVSRKIFNGKNAVITTDLQKEIDTANAAKEVATKALQELADKKVELAKAESELANEKQKRELAEAYLADKSKTTDAKIKAYQDALARAPVVRVVPESIADQCARAKALELELDACK